MIMTMTIEEVYNNLCDMVDQEFNSDDIVEAFGDYEYNGITQVIISQMVDDRHIYEVYINDEYSPVIEITVDCDDIIRRVEW